MRQLALITLAGLGLAVAALPAQAANTGQNSAREAQEPDRTRAEAASERRICVRTRFSNSRMTRNICKTQAEWDAQGGLDRDD